jgi:hypothetical protein
MERAVLNLNRANLSLEPINTTINSALERVASATDRPREQYLGASILGDECLRRIQFEWWCRTEHSAQTRERFRRGDYFEERMRQHLIAAGFRFAPREMWEFSAVKGVLRGHADGIIIHGPDLPGAYMVYPLVWEHKCLKATSYREIERDGLEKRHANYLAQVALYQAYLNITNPALFTVTNADTCEWLHFLVRFDAERAQMWSDRAANIIAATRASELLPRGFSDPDKFPCKQCPHRERCWGL